MITLYKSAFVLAAVVALAIPSIHGNLAGVKCIVDGNASATDSWSTNWHDGRIYFSSYESFTKFNSRPAAFELKANHQLLVTGQYEQHSCPCCGGAIDKEREQSINVGGVTVHFASPDCLDSISELPNITDRATAVYADEHFERTFQPVADDENN